MDKLEDGGTRNEPGTWSSVGIAGVGVVSVSIAATSVSIIGVEPADNTNGPSSRESEANNSSCISAGLRKNDLKKAMVWSGGG